MPMRGQNWSVARPGEALHSLGMSPPIQDAAIRLARGRRLTRVRLATLVILALSGCLNLAGCSDVTYVARAAYEEGRLLWHRRPIRSELASDDLSPEIRDRLETVLKVREFARDKLGLNVGGAYTTVTDVEQGAVVWVVMAAPQDSLTPYSWWFPIVGSVPYRGYFSHEAAEKEASNMEGAGYDTYIRPAVAFSSLGFFDDPLLSDLLKLNRVELAGVIIHELFHRTYFLASDVMFDESAATYVGNRGAIDYFNTTEGPNSRDTEAARGMLESDFKFAHFLDEQRARLSTVYATNLPQEELLKRRKVLFAEISSDYVRQKRMLSGLERFNLDKTPINNAVLIDYLIYFHDFDNFATLERMHHGDLRATIHSIIELAKNNPEDPFFAIWQATHSTHAMTTVSSPSTSR